MAQMVRVSDRRWINLDNVCEIREAANGRMTVSFNTSQSVEDKDSSPIYEARVELDAQESEVMRRVLSG
jgi:hypothetical protein